MGKDYGLFSIMGREALAKAASELQGDVFALSAKLATLRAEVEKLREKMGEIVETLDGEPEYHYQGMGCGLEDRNITDRYDAMEYGWDKAMERIYSEHISHALDLAKEALK